MLLGRKYGKLERYRKNATCLVRPACIPGNGAGKDSEQNILTFPVMTVDFPCLIIVCGRVIIYILDQNLKHIFCLRIIGVRN